MRRLVAVALSIGLSLAGIGGSALAQEISEIMTAVDGNASAVGPGNASASPGTVTRPGASVLGPDEGSSIVDTGRSGVSIAGDTEILPTPTEAATAPASTVSGCDSYSTWYDAQVAYEAAGMTTADPAVVNSLDPDYDGIACEEAM